MQKGVKSKTVLITGALGHIGSRLIREINSSHVDTVVMLDNLESQRYPSLFNLSGPLRYLFIENDIRTADMQKCLEGVDIVIHLAALTNAEGSFRQVKKVESVNFTGLQRVADACLQYNVRLLFPSTTSVYGSQAKQVDESCQELLPQSPYAETKLSSERYLEHLGKEGLAYCTCRFGTIFGSSIGMRFHTAVNKFIWQAVNGQPISVWKTAWNQKRPYLDLGDCVAAINFIIERDLFNGDVYNVLTDNFTVQDIVEIIQKFVPDLVTEFVDSPIMNQLSYKVDNAKFSREGFVSQGKLKSSIGDTINQFKEIMRYENQA